VVTPDPPVQEAPFGLILAMHSSDSGLHYPIKFGNSSISRY
jgi:hypothetical protein